jgi:two-component system sensor histidine kinase AlgZ
MPTFFYRSRVLWLHLSFWCVYLSFLIYQISGFQQGQPVWSRVILSTTVSLAFTMLIAYLNYFLLLPRFLERKKVGKYLLEFLIPFVMLIITRVYLERSISEAYDHHVRFFFSTRFVVHAVAITLFITIFVAMLRFAEDWFELEARKKAIENEKLTAELNFLKAQINPHFLFNTLNNLYYLAYTQSPNTTEVIAKLSQMMRYMIYDSNHPQVLLSKEIEYMQNYISLESLRLNNEVPINFKVNGNLQQIKIVPLIFITFLENAFKHGVSNSIPGSWINAEITINGTECIYMVENSRIAQASKAMGEKSGIGLQNVQRRLDLSYPDQYQLKIDEQPDRYVVELTLKLTNYELSDHRRRAVSA